MAFSAFTAIAEKILPAANAIATISGDLITAVVPVILIGLTIIIMWYGFEILRGGGGPNPFLDIFAKSLRALIVFQLALAGGMYAANVVDFVTDFRGDMTSKVSTATGGTSVNSGAIGSYNQIDDTMEKAAQGTNKVFEWGYQNIDIYPFNVTGLVAIAAGALMMGCMVIYGFVATVNLLLIDFALKILFGVGPLFVACFAFQATARFFDAWLGGVLKYTFTAIVIACVVGIGNGIIDGFATALQGDPSNMDFLGAAVGALGACGVLIGIAIRAPSIAADIVGGIGIAAVGPGAIARPMAAASAAMAGGAAKGGAYMAGGAMKAGSAAATSQVARDTAAGAKSIGGAVGGAVAQTSLGQKALAATAKISSAGSAVAASKVGQGAAAVGRVAGSAASAAGRGAASLGSYAAGAANAVGSKGSTVGSAFSAGRGAGSGLGSVSGPSNQRPIPGPTSRT